MALLYCNGGRRGQKNIGILQRKRDSFMGDLMAYTRIYIYKYRKFRICERFTMF